MKPNIYQLGSGAEVHLYPTWLDNPREKFAEAEKLSWTDEIVSMYAKRHVIARRTVNYGLPYSYNKTATPPVEWEPLALELKQKLEAEFQIEFQQCACNEYSSVSAYIGPHHDKDTVIHGEKREPLYIASISLGSERKMVLTPPGADLKVSMTVRGLMSVPGAIGIDLPPGSLVLFPNAFNRFWKHSIPKDSKGMAGKRISLTYRHF
jgi:alkylated DNA repair dioxygenase AlkB